MIYYTDGFTIFSNPSDFGGGYTIVDEKNNLKERCQFDKKGFTNNEGELLGVYNCLLFCKKGDVIITDSKCITFWCKSGKSKARPDLNEKIMMSKMLLFEKSVKLEWKPREENLAGHYNENNK